jgi:hypothetical protein
VLLALGGRLFNGDCVAASEGGSVLLQGKIPQPEIGPIDLRIACNISSCTLGRAAAQGVLHSLSSGSFLDSKYFTMAYWLMARANIRRDHDARRRPMAIILLLASL